jgi:uncharacterized protein (DUF58 family)
MKKWLAPVLNPAACVESPVTDSLWASNADILLKRLEALLRHPVTHGISGDRRSLLRGHGLDLADLRQYFPGDDIRKIDWNVFARTMAPHIKQYQEEKQLQIWIAVDLTPSMFFGTPVSKAQKAAELAALLGLMIQQGRHKLGFYLMSANGHQIIPPASGRLHLEHGMEALLRAIRTETQTVAAMPMDFFDTLCGELARMIKGHVSVFLLSDFLTFSTKWTRELGHLSRRAQVHHILIEDPVEIDPGSGMGLVEVFDPETGKTQVLDTRDKRFLARYRHEARAYREGIMQALAGTGTVSVTRTTEPLTDSLLGLMKGMQPS